MVRPVNPPLDLDTFEAVGVALYGPQWGEPMAAALGVSRQSVSAWRSGRVSPPRGVRLELAVLLAARAVECPPLAAALREIE